MLFVKRDSSPLWSGGHKEDFGGMGIDGMNLKLHALSKFMPWSALKSADCNPCKAKYIRFLSLLCSISYFYSCLRFGLFPASSFILR